MITSRGIYCFKVMPFRLKNTGATYQYLVNKMFTDFIGDTIEVYIDDMIIKSLKVLDHLNHLHQAFAVLSKYGMKLNLVKCSFGVTSGKFWGYQVMKRGIEADPHQIRVVANIPSPKNIKKVLKLTGLLTALNIFISKYSDKSHNFFDTIKKGKSFDWTPECEAALSELKSYMSSPLLLSKPLSGENLLIYLYVSYRSSSAVLVREVDRRQHPIYYVSRSLLDAKTHYPRLEKLALALVMASQKPKPYFQSHSITVVTSFPLKVVLSRPDISGRLAKWAINLTEYGLSFEPHTIIKSQVLADFIADFSIDQQIAVEKEVFEISNGS